MTNEKFGLADLELDDNLTDVGVEDAAGYQDQSNPAPPVAGNYGFKITGISARRNRDTGELILQNDRYPILSLDSVELSEGYVDGQGQPTTRKVFVFQDVPTKPFDRRGVSVSALADLIRSYDAARTWRGVEEGKEILKEIFDSGAQLHAQFDWSVYDSALVKAALEQLQIPANREERTDEQKAQINAIYKAARITGMKFFHFNEKSERFEPVISLGNVTITPKGGTPVTIEVEPRSLEPRPTITRYYPSTDVASGRVRLGPSRVKPAVKG